jgi:hypothetical protein
MTNPKGMDKFFWGKDMEDVFYLIDQKFQMDIEVKELDEDKLFKITKIDLKGKAWD